MMRKKTLKSGQIILIGILFFHYLLPFALAGDEIKIKIIAVNPSPDKNLKTTISQPLPAEVTSAQDVLDPAGFTVRYDPDKKTSWLMQQVELKPKEVKTFEVTVRNVWMISPDEIAEVREQLEKSMNSLKDTKYFETSRLLFEKAQETLTQMEENQGKPIGIKQRVELYHAHRKQLQDIQNNAFSLEAMRRLEEEQTAGVREAKFAISAENPSAEEKKMKVRTVLPEEITSNDVLEKLGFNLVYDEAKNAYALEKEEIFAAKEKKSFRFILRDIWYIAPKEIHFVRDQAMKLSGFLEESSYKDYALQQRDSAVKLLDEILLMQEEISETAELTDRMRAFVLNSQKMEVAKKKIKELQDLLPEVSLKLEKESKKDVLEPLKNFMKSLASAAMGYNPNQSVTWFIIFGIIAFLGVISIIFYLAWLKKLQENRWAKKPQPSSKEQKPNPAPSPATATHA